MMKRILLSLFLTVLASSLWAQNAVSTVGFNISPIWSSSEKAHTNDFELSGGLFYNQSLFKRLDIQTGINYLQINLIKFQEDQSGNFLHYNYSKDLFDIIEIPIELSYQLAEIERFNVSFHLNAGYSLGQIVHTNRMMYSDERTSKGPIENPDLNRTIHFTHGGFEIRHTFMDVYRFSYGSTIRMTNIDDETYGTVYSWSSFLRVGRLLNW